MPAKMRKNRCTPQTNTYKWDEASKSDYLFIRLKIQLTQAYNFFRYFRGPANRQASTKSEYVLKLLFKDMSNEE